MEGLGWELILKRVGIRDLCGASGIRPAKCMDRSHSCPQSHVQALLGGSGGRSRLMMGIIGVTIRHKGVKSILTTSP